MEIKHRPITVGSLIDALSVHNPDDIVDFGPLHFYRLKQRGPGVVQAEFNESMYLDDEGNVVVESHE